MRATFLAAVATIGLTLAGPALAFHCPTDMAAIDKKLAENPQLSADQLAEVKKLRAEGEAAHKAGNHQESVDSLAKAKSILGIQ